MRDSGFRLEAFFIDKWLVDEGLKIDIKETYMKGLIVMIDCNSLHCPINQDLVEIFDSSSIGGGIIPVCETFSKEDRDSQRNLYSSHLKTWYRCKYHCDYLGRAFINIELEVPNKKKLFRRLTNIAIKNLEIEEVIKSGNWADKFRGSGLDNQSASFT